MSLRAMLFDAAGTLIHVREPVGETYARLARGHGVVAAAEHLNSSFHTAMRRRPAMVFPGACAEESGKLEQRWWHELVQDVFATAAPMERFSSFDVFFNAVFAYYAQPAAWVVGNEVVPTLEALRGRGLKTGMISNFDYRLSALLDGLGLAPLLDVVIRPADVGAAKPDPRIFHAALEGLQVAAGEALYVGDDDDEDVRGARAAGLRAINVRTLPAFASLLDEIGAEPP